MYCKALFKPTECVVLSISSKSNTENGSCTRTGTMSAPATSPCTSARCTCSELCSLNNTASNAPAGVLMVYWPTRSTSFSRALRYSIKSAIVPIFSPWVSANSSNSGKRAISPSGFITSQITADGVKSAKRVKSQPASVCPARTKTPPSRARRGNMCPGWTISLAPNFGLAATAIVRARSDAEIPVVTPSRASIETVKFVPYCVPFSPAPTIIGKPSSSQRASVKHRHTKPRACVTIKLIAAGVTKSLAMTKSPSFSRSSSSTRTTMRPALSSAMISCVVAIDIRHFL